MCQTTPGGGWLSIGVLFFPSPRNNVGGFVDGSHFSLVLEGACWLDRTTFGQINIEDWWGFVFDFTVDAPRLAERECDRLWCRGHSDFSEFFSPI